MLKNIQAPGSAILFLHPSTLCPITPQVFRTWWNTRLIELGYSPEQFTPHSLRRASASWAYSQGADEIAIQRFVGWKTITDRTYINFDYSASINASLVSALL